MIEVEGIRSSSNSPSPSVQGASMDAGAKGGVTAAELLSLAAFGAIEMRSR